MLNSRQKRLLWLAVLCVAGLISLKVLQSAMADDEPVLIITKTGAGIYTVGITNGTNTGFYELYHTPVLADSAYPWTLVVVGTQGQTNFSVTNTVNFTGYFFVGVGNDWDSDGADNYKDADANDPDIGQLTITIDNPTNGELIQ